ncbi:MAG TPA: DUF2510 domain-containing protein [Galbitalea sp.]|nr:DUF2510 domain-containing protein [Galbitalea sp.]
MRGHTISSETQTRLPAGWYTDPGQSGGKRWWDGTQWTSHLKMPDAPAAKAAAVTGHTNPHGIGIAPASSYGIGVVPASNYDAVAYATADRVPVRKPKNNTAFLSLLFGLLSIGFMIVTFLPGPKTYWVVGAGAIAILLGIIAIAQRISGRTTNVWAPILGILLGGAATGLMLMGIAVLSLFDSAAGGLLPTSSTTANAEVAPPPASSEPFVFPANPALTADGSAVQQLATAMNQKYASGKPTLAAGQTWPTTIKPTGAQVTAADGSVIATMPTGDTVGYSLSADQKSYTITVAGANRTEVASYASGIDRFSFTCLATDTNCSPTR